jgi:SAM-dependent methyltransferase
MVTAMTRNVEKLTAKMEAFDSFWEAPENIEKGYSSFGSFYRKNYLRHFPDNKNSNILVISCGPGYMVKLLNEEGYRNVIGIDSIEEKIQPALNKKLNCKQSEAFGFLEENQNSFDAIFAEQEINHLTKTEILDFLELCLKSLRKDGTLIIHSLNGANPIVGSENMALNFDHYNLFTEKSLKQILDYKQFKNIRIIPLRLYVFYNNPVNYVGILLDSIFNILFKLIFVFYGKNNKIFSKKIGAVARKPVDM